MEFVYEPEHADECLHDTETALREMVDVELSKRHGPSWEMDANMWHSTQTEGERVRADLITRRQTEASSFPHQKTAERLLDYTTVNELRQLIVSNWSDLSTAFSGDKSRLDRCLRILEELRNPLSHARQSQLLDHQRYLVLGACGEILVMINNWRLGFFKKPSQFTLTFSLFPTREDTDHAGEASLRQAVGWLERTAAALGGWLEPRSDLEWMLRSNKGHVQAQLTPYRGSDRGYFRAVTLGATSYSFPAITELVRVGGKPYWRFEGRLSNRLDLAAIQKETERLNLVRPHGTIHFNGALESLSYSLGNFQGEGISLELSCSERAEGSSYAIAFEGSASHGFYCAHELFGIGFVRSFLAGQWAPMQLKKRLLEAMGPYCPAACPPAPRPRS